MIKLIAGWGSLFFLVVVVMGVFKLPSLDTISFTSNFMSNSGVIKAFLSVLILFLVAYILFIGVLLRKYSLKVEKLSFGGVNVLLDNSDKLFEKSVTNFLDTKRTLFKIIPELDSFDESLNSYFETYNFFRNEMKILNLRRRKDRELYRLSNEVLKVLNKFLTENQNNYRRWHRYISESDMVGTGEKDSKGKVISLKYHSTPIGTIQTHYYHYPKILSGFEEVNIFFEKEIKSRFHIDTAKWSW